MATYSYDTTLPNPAFTNLVRVTNSIPTSSPLTRATTVDVRAGSHWLYTLNYQNLTEDKRADVLGYFSRLNGREHRCRLPMFNEARRGAWSGTPLVAGAAQTGSTIDIDGAGSSVTNWARRGDFFRFDNCIRQVTVDADSDGAGATTLEFWPPIRTSPANNEPVLFASTITGIYMLVTDIDADSRADVAGAVNRSSLSLTFMDDILAT